MWTLLCNYTSNYCKIQNVFAVVHVESNWKGKNLAEVGQDQGGTADWTEPSPARFRPYVLCAALTSLQFNWSAMLDLVDWNWREQIDSQSKDLIQFKACPLMPNTSSSLCRWIRRSTASTATLRSSRANSSTDGRPLSDVIGSSFFTLSSAVSVLWSFLKPDWNASISLPSCKKWRSCLATIASNILDRNIRLETGPSLDW